MKFERNVQQDTGQSIAELLDPEQLKLFRTKLELDGSLPCQFLAALFPKIFITVVIPSILLTTCESIIPKLWLQKVPHSI